jgi:hypothetical protein
MYQLPQTPALAGQPPVRFAFKPLANADANDFLRRSADHLATLTDEKRADWFRDWIPAMQRAKLRPGMTLFDQSLVIMTLEGWQSPAPASSQVPA